MKQFLFFLTFSFLVLPAVSFGAGVLPTASTTSALRVLYDSAGSGGRPVRILVAPGHEPSRGGAGFAGRLERDMAVYLSTQLISLLKTDSHFDVLETRDFDTWSDSLTTYFSTEWSAIATFRQKHIDSMKQAYVEGTFVKKDGVTHNTSDIETSMHLFGINKWANENGVDLILNLHFNDNPRFRTGMAGEYQGLALYVPDSQYQNGTASQMVGQSLFTALNQYIATSTHPKEKAGVVEDEELTALGANKTLLAPSVLLEYGYIYEPQYDHKDIRREVLNDLAYYTASGIDTFFGSHTATTSPSRLGVSQVNTTKGFYSTAIYQLQRKLALFEVYPPAGRSLYDCPFTGVFGSCTRQAIALFQKQKNILETGLGQKTIDALDK